MTLEWKSPGPVTPPSGGNIDVGRKYAEIARELQKKPGSWAVLMEHSSHSKARAQVSNINRGLTKSLRGCKATQRGNVVFVSWTGVFAHEEPEPEEVTQLELCEFIDRLGLGYSPNELAEELRLSYRIYPISSREAL